MKIVYLHQYFTTPSMHGGTRSYEFAQRLIVAGHDVHMITSDRVGTGKAYATVEDGITVTWIPVAYSNNMGAFARLRAFLTFAMKAAIIAASIKADVIFATSTPLTIALPAVFAKWRQRAPMVFEVRDPWPDMLIGLGAIRNPVTKTLARLLERFAYRNSDRLIALSDGIRDIVAATGYPESKISVIPNASDIDRFDVSPAVGHSFREQFDWLKDRKLVLYAGSVGIANGVDYLVHVAEKMLAVDETVRFLVIGAGGQEAAVRELARNKGVLDTNFFMLPPVAKTGVAAAFSAAGISLVLLKDVKELWTNSSNKFFDGLAAARPVVVNNTGWQATLLEQTAAGFMIDPRDHTAAAKKLHHYLDDEDWLRTAGANARKLAKDRFDREQLAQQFQQVLVEASTR